MKFKLLFATVAAVIGLAASSQAQPSTYPGAKAQQVYHYMTAPSPHLFNSQELSIDLGPSYTTPEGTTIFDKGGGKGVWGLEGSATYWIKRFAGIGLYGGIVNTKQNNDLLLSHLGPEISGRLPFDLFSNSSPFKNIAIVGDFGIGKDFRNGCYQTVADGGMDIRLWKHLGIGGKYQHIWETASGNNENKILAFLQVAF